MIINPENNQISQSIKYSQSAKLFIYTKIPDATALWISFFELSLKCIAPEQVVLSLFILIYKLTRLKIWQNLFPLKYIFNFRHRRSTYIDEIILLRFSGISSLFL